MTEENTLNRELKPVLIVYRQEDREEILNILQNAGIPAKARAREMKTKQVNDIVFVTGHRKRGEEICVEAPFKNKADKIISGWMEEKQNIRGQSRPGSAFFFGKNNTPAGKILTVVIVIVVIILYLSRLM